jgi:hypothetical protein
MGSVVKSIGRVFKKAGKALKKIAPVLLVAAAAYVGYGYATGFSGGGWPKITGWGKSLMRGIRGGSSLSQAASQASQGFVAPTSGMATVGESMFDPGMGPGGASEFASTQGLLGGTPTISPSENYTAMGMFGGGGGGSGMLGETPDAVASTSGLTARDIRGRPPSLYEALFNPAEEQLVQAQVANPNDFEFNSVLEIPGSQATLDPVVVTASPSDVASQSATGAATGTATGMPARTFDMSTLTGSGPGLASLGSGASNAGNVDLNNPQTWITALGSKAGKAWEFYKELWKNDPMIALYGTNKVIQMVAALLAKDEKDKKYEYGGFNPDVSYSQLASIQGNRTKPAPKPGTVLGPRTGLLSNPQGANV